MFPYANAHVAQTMVTRGMPVGHATPNVTDLPAGLHALFDVPAVVDVSGMEMAVAVRADASTGTTQTIATGATTVVLKPYDGGTNAGGASDNNELFAVTDFSNSATGASSWTVIHGAIGAVGTSTTDLDADDWVNLDVAANITGAGGLGIIAVTAHFIYGVPSAVN